MEAKKHLRRLGRGALRAFLALAVFSSGAAFAQMRVETVEAGAADNPIARMPSFSAAASLAPLDMVSDAPVIILPDSDLGDAAKPARTIIRPRRASKLLIPTPRITLPESKIIKAPAPKIIIVDRPVPEEKTDGEKPSTQEHLRKLVQSLGLANDAAGPGADRSHHDSPLNAYFDGELAPEAADWDKISGEFAQGPLAPSLPRVETAARSMLARLAPRLYRRVPAAFGYDLGKEPRTGHTWTPGQRHRIEFAPVSADFRGDVASAFGSPQAARVQQKIEYIAAYAHEYAHVLFDSAVRPKEDHAPHSAYSAMTEGFAVTVEQLFIQRLLDQTLELGLTPRDALDLSAIARARRQWLAEQDTHYSEGVLSWRQAYAEGGDTALLSFLSSLSARRMILVSRADPAYQLAVGDWKLLSAYLGDDKISTERRGLDAFARASRGEELNADESRDAGLVIEQAGAQARRRLFERTLLADKRIMEPEGPAQGEKGRNWYKPAELPPGRVDPAFALARLSPAAAAELPRFLARIMSSPNGAARLFERPGPNDKLSAVVAGAERLPWNEADHKTWMDGLTRWLIKTN
ncbi:MAG: hypothetical protein KGI84_04520 [Elusimicrobia bacterium]|nr:hypothetical protein [Elusimicrobiota bacterium]